MPVQERARGAIAAAFVISALVLGGGGSSAPLSELLLQLCAALAAAAWILVSRHGGAVQTREWRLAALAGIVLLLPCLQLIPLPPALWQQLPGREAERSALELIGEGRRWMPWSIAPSRSWASLLSLGPPLLAMGMVACLNQAGRTLVIAAIAATMLASLVLGALQLAGGLDGSWRPYGTDNIGFLNGFQANRNAQADVVLIGLVAGAVVLRARASRLGARLADVLLAGLVATSLIGCILTGSRAGMALIPVAVAAVLAIRLNGARSVRAVAMAVAGTTAILGLGFAALRQTGPFAQSLGRFTLGRDFRMELWADTRFAIGQYWPFGSGVGTFRPAYIAAERLEAVVPTNPVRAHNDYLELALEGGAFGFILLATAILLLFWLAVRAWQATAPCTRSGGQGARLPATALARSQLIFAFCVVGIVALHSIVDYPLRSMSIACLAGVAAGLLATGRRVRADTEIEQS